MRGKDTDKIVKLLEKGLTITEITNKGYSWGTVRYHARRLRNPKAHEKFLKKFRVYQSKRRKHLSTVLSKKK